MNNKTTLQSPSVAAPRFLGIIFFLLGFLAAPGIMAQEDMADQYSFDLGITYEMASGKPGKLKNNTQMSMWFSNAEHVGMQAGEQKEMFMIYDMKAMKMITLMEAQKMAMVMDMKKMQERMASQVKQQEAAAEDVQITKTGRSEKILGYSSDEYKITSKEGENLVWITKELGQGMGNFSKSFSSMMNSNPKSKKVSGMDKMEEGVMLRMEFTSNNGKDASKFEAKEVHKDGKTVSTAGYQVMKMPGM